MLENEVDVVRAIVQRVSAAAVSAPGRERRDIGPGLVVLLGVGNDDGEDDVRYLADKILHLRIFEDQEGKMNLSLLETGGKLLVVSQFTLYGDCRKGRRPAFSDAARPEPARELYAFFAREAAGAGVEVLTGYFQEHMLVEIMNDGPVTLMLDSRKNF